MSSLVISLVAYYQTKKTMDQGLSIGQYYKKRLLNFNIWWSESSRVDYGLFLFNGLIKVLLISTIAVSLSSLPWQINTFLQKYFGGFVLHIKLEELILIYTLVSVVTMDFASFLVHWLSHRVKFLWRFHSVHHSAQRLNPLTQYRIHPVELLLNNGKAIVVTSVLGGSFLFLSGGRLQTLDIMGVNVLSFLFLSLGANLRHSEIPLRYFKWMEFVLISPLQHQVHHSNKKEYCHSNYGAKFAIWDWAFGSLVRSCQLAEKDLSYGLRKRSKLIGFWKNLWLPFKP